MHEIILAGFVDELEKISVVKGDKALAKLIQGHLDRGEVKVVKGIFDKSSPFPENLSQMIRDRLKSGKYGRIRGVFDKRTPPRPQGPTAPRILV